MHNEAILELAFRVTQCPPPKSEEKILAVDGFAKPPAALH